MLATAPTPTVQHDGLASMRFKLNCLAELRGVAWGHYRRAQLRALPDGVQDDRLHEYQRITAAYWELAERITDREGLAFG